MGKSIYAFILSCFLTLCVQAQLQVADFFGDHMVLQRGKPLPVWGRAAPGAEVTVSFRNDSVSTVAGVEGKWMVELPPQSVGQPGRLRVASGGQTVMLEDVLVGEVWIASGQSNIEWPVLKSANPEAEVAAADFPQIRFLTVPRTFSPQALDGFDAVCRSAVRKRSAGSQRWPIFSGASFGRN